MIYFTYKLKMVNGSGYSPKQDVSQTWLDVGHCPLNDGTMLGYSTKSSLLDTFTAEEITDFSIVEITQLQACDRCRTGGMNDPIVDNDGYIVDSNPPYLETRGWKYIENLGGIKP